MGIRDRFSNFLFRQIEKRGWLDDYNRTIRYGGRYADNENILESSDVYELLQDISNQMMLAEILVEDRDGNEIRNDPALKVLKNPNNYLTGSEFIKLMTNTFLLQGEVFPLLNKDQLHIAANIQTELDDQLVEQFKIGVGGVTVPQTMIRHIKNIGTNHLKGVGILDLGKNTLEGVMNAEKVLTDKYKKGGLLAVVQLPFVPDQDQRKAKYHPQDRAADVVHGDFFGEVVEEAGVISRENSRVARGASCGTGSWPPLHQGWQRASRPSVSQVPAAAPCCCRACSE